jgi:type I restriction enzyme M protein
MQAFYIELEKRLWEAADFPSGPTLNSSLRNIPSPFWGWFFCCTLTISLAWFHRKLQREAAGGARWVRRITRHSWALYLPETARFNYLIDRPEAEDIGGAINAAMKAIADENEELGGALPRNYNSLEKPILRELLKILNRIPRENITEDAFGEIYQYFLWNFAQKKGPKAESFLLPFHW